VNNHSLKSRLLAGLLTSLTLVVAAGCAGLFWLQRELLYDDFDRQLLRRSFTQFGEGRRSPRLATQPAPDQADAEPPRGLLFVDIWDLSSGERERTIPAGMDLGPRPLARLPKSDSPAFSSVRLADGRHVRVVANRMRFPSFRGRRTGRGERRGEGATDPADRPDRRADNPDEGRPGWRGDPSADAQGDQPPAPPRRPPPAPRDLAMLAGADLAPVDAALGRWLMILLGSGAAGVFLVAAVVLIVVRSTLGPLRVLEADIASIDDSDLAHRVRTERLPAELEPMVRQINDLLSRLSDAFNRERDFTASAAHEFRTPLAGIRTQMEVCLRRPRSAEEYRATLTECLDAALSLQQMVDLMLNLARLDSSQTTPDVETVDVAPLVTGQWARFSEVAGERNCSALIDVPDRLDLRTDAVLLDGILANLLSNAAEYADAGGRITVSARAVETGLRIRVCNSAATLGQDDVERMFDRFWRKDAARHATGRHCGLGLAIVQRCTRALGGTVNAELTAGELCMTVNLPAWPD
jgi:signal transduction histidine kinase